MITIERRIEIWEAIYNWIAKLPTPRTENGLCAAHHQFSISEERCYVQTTVQQNKPAGATHWWWPLTIGGDVNRMDFCKQRIEELRNERAKAMSVVVATPTPPRKVVVDGITLTADQVTRATELLATPPALTLGEIKKGEYVMMGDFTYRVVSKSPNLLTDRMMESTRVMLVNSAGELMWDFASRTCERRGGY